ncbi:type VI secretion system ImpA family N-terminal domain-containing protein [Pseudomonas sp. NPDC086251]|uniref:type VI secretion system ImpA family N-terminal domain-containing protein n=1 Tax=Pseudomonas sp. NPDC086251 TaxID=3364431 RepID=UPI0038399F75
MRDELAKLSHPACPDVDWAKVEQLCLTLFHHNGAELQTAAFALACSQRHGLEGMAQGVTLIESLCSEWSTVWPPMVSGRLEILAWLFTQWQSLLRHLRITTQTLPVLEHLSRELERLVTQLQRQGQVRLVTLQPLRHQVSSLMLRLEHNAFFGELLPISTRVPEPAFVMPVVILPAHPMPEVPPAAWQTRKNYIVLWLLALTVTIALVCGVWWRSQMAGHHQSQQAANDAVRLDSLSLFGAGSAELEPDSTNVLINALVNIKAQPG